MISTRPKCSRKLFLVIADLMQMIPNAFYYPREQYTVKELCDYAMGRNFTHLVILGEKKKVCNGYVPRLLVSVV
jgi:ribosome production factor 1